jgi:hypothetical protein
MLYRKAAALAAGASPSMLVLVTRLELVGKMHDLTLPLEAVDHQIDDDVENSEN